MQSSLYVSTAAQSVLQKQLITVANNIANSNTVGFRAEGVDFKSLISNTGSNPVHFPTLTKIHASTEQGTLKETENPLDIAVSGPGWLAIQTPSGVAYTKDGRMKINEFGELQSIVGYSILDAGEAPIQLDPSGGTLTITPDGRILQNKKPVANVGVFDADPQNFISRFENASFLSSVRAGPIALGGSTTISQGYLESSNVNPMRELANLITITRSFEHAAATIEKADSAISTSIRELGNTRG